MSQEMKEHIPKDNWIKKVKPRLIEIKEALKNGIPAYYFKNSDTEERSITYNIKIDSVYRITQKNLLNKKLIERLNLSSTTSNCSQIYETNKIKDINSREAGLYVIDKGESHLAFYLRGFNSKNNIYTQHFATLSRDKKFEFALLLLKKTNEDGYKYTFTDTEVEQYFGRDYLRKERSNVIQAYRAEQRKQAYKVNQLNFKECLQLQQEIEDLIIKRAEMEFDNLLNKLINENNNRPYPMVKKSVGDLLQTIKSTAKSSPKHLHKLLEILEGLEAILDSKENPTNSTESFANLAINIHSSVDKKSQKISNYILAASFILTVCSIVMMILCVSFQIQCNPLYPYHFAILLVGSLQIGFLGFQVNISSKPTRLYMDMLDVCYSIEKDTNLVEQEDSEHTSLVSHTI